MTKLSNPPIREAIIQISYSLPKEFKVEEFKPILTFLKSSYPTVKEQVSFSITAIAESGKIGNTKKESELAGYLLINSEKTQIIQITRNTLSLSRQRPYTSWEKIHGEMKFIWDEFPKFYPKIIPNKISVRYVNKLDLDLSQKKGLQDFFHLNLNLPEGIPNTLSRSLIQFQVIHPNNKLLANITKSINCCSKTKNLIHATLDIEVNGNLSEESDINELFQKIRVFKNELFFKSITETTKNLYNGQS